MAKKEWFFKRGNVRVSWETAPNWAQWVAVDRSGRVFAFCDKPLMVDDRGFWKESKYCGVDELEIAYVGKVCPDWKDLIFERPLLPHILAGWELVWGECTPCKPIITREEWDAIRLLLPGAKYVAKDFDGAVYAFDSCPTTLYEKFVLRQGKWMRVVILEQRFENVPWRESLVKYEEKE